MFPRNQTVRQGGLVANNKVSFFDRSELVGAGHNSDVLHIYKGNMLKLFPDFGQSNTSSAFSLTRMSSCRPNFLLATYSRTLTMTLPSIIVIILFRAISDQEKNFVYRQESLYRLVHLAVYSVFPTLYIGNQFLSVDFRAVSLIVKTVRSKIPQSRYHTRTGYNNVWQQFPTFGEPDLQRKGGNAFQNLFDPVPEHCWGWVRYLQLYTLTRLSFDIFSKKLVFFISFSHNGFVS